MIAHFNIALYPQNATLVKLLIELAGKSISGRTDNYRLGPQALPHLSLCQFVCEQVELHAVWTELADLRDEPLCLTFGHIYIRPGVGPLHHGKNWVGLSVVPTEHLLDLQKSVYGRLHAMGIESATSPKNYFAHLTLGRLSESFPITISHLPAADFWQTTFPFEISLGKSNDLGVYIERLY